MGVDPETGNPEAHTILDRRTRAPEPLVSNTLLYPEALCEEAFATASDNLCGPRQMAALLKCDMGEICTELSRISQELYGTEQWEDDGATPRMVMEYCRRQGCGCVVIHNEEVIENLPGADPVLAFAVHEDHVYFYKAVAITRALAKRKGPGEAPRLRKAQKQSQTPPASEWERWKCLHADEPEDDAFCVRPGHCWAFEDEMGSIRAWFLQHRKSPKLLMKRSARSSTTYGRTRKMARESATFTRCQSTSARCRAGWNDSTWACSIVARDSRPCP